jgi:hypothetical protein
VNISVYISRIEHLHSSLEKAKRLAEMSSRYVKQITAVQERIAEMEEAQREQMRGYVDKVGRLGEYELGYIRQALDSLKGREPLPREQAVLTLLGGQVLEFHEQRRADRDGWAEQFAQAFAGFDG